jgi:hypothetical protein
LFISSQVTLSIRVGNREAACEMTFAEVLKSIQLPGCEVCVTFVAIINRRLAFRKAGKYLVRKLGLDAFSL